MMTRMRILVLALLAGTLAVRAAAPVPGTAPAPAAVPATAVITPAAAADAALDKAAAFLLARQAADGSWMNTPAVTALDAYALGVAPGRNRPEMQAAIRRGLDYVAGRAQPDGSIFNPEVRDYPSYSTAICTVVLAQFNRSQDAAVIRAARDYLLKTQFTDAAKDGLAYGGIGYGSGSRPDLSNTSWAFEALHLTEHLDREPFAKDPARAREADLAWERAVKFLEQCQNLKPANRQAWVTDDPENKGGFVYKPVYGNMIGGEAGGPPPADDKKGPPPTGKPERKPLAPHSYGSMTYAGVKSLIYAKLTPDDPRVQAAREWLRQHYTFDENPGMKDAGLYYYLLTGARALTVLGQDELTLPDGTKRRWRDDLTKSLVGRQKPDGSWSNRNNRWWEKMPELSTGYSAMALATVLGRTPQAENKDK